MTWNIDPLWRKPLPRPTFVVLHGGLGPTPGEACRCPGNVGDLDSYGRPGGHTVDNSCPTHGTEARRRAERQARQEWLVVMRTLDEALEEEALG